MIFFSDQESRQKEKARNTEACTIIKTVSSFYWKNIVHNMVNQNTNTAQNSEYIKSSFSCCHSYADSLFRIMFSAAALFHFILAVPFYIGKTFMVCCVFAFMASIAF